MTLIKIKITNWSNNWSEQRYEIVSPLESQREINSADYDGGVEFDNNNYYHNGKEVCIVGVVKPTVVTGCNKSCPFYNINDNNGCHTAHTYWNDNNIPCKIGDVVVV